jgi:hypothetical protein
MLFIIFNKNIYVVFVTNCFLFIFAMIYYAISKQKQRIHYEDSFLNRRKLHQNKAFSVKRIIPWNNQFDLIV